MGQARSVRPRWGTLVLHKREAVIVLSPIPGDGFLSSRHEIGGTAGIEPGTNTGNGSHRHRISVTTTSRSITRQRKRRAHHRHHDGTGDGTADTARRERTTRRERAAITPSWSWVGSIVRRIGTLARR